jgi:hypothetical protein
VPAFIWCNKNSKKTAGYTVSLPRLEDRTSRKHFGRVVPYVSLLDMEIMFNIRSAIYICQNLMANSNAKLQY